MSIIKKTCLSRICVDGCAANGSDARAHAAQDGRAARRPPETVDVTTAAAGSAICRTHEDRRVRITNSDLWDLCNIICIQ